MPIVNKQVKILTSQYIGTCKSAYTKGYALNWALTLYSMDEMVDEAKVHQPWYAKQIIYVEG